MVGVVILFMGFITLGVGIANYNVALIGLLLAIFPIGIGIGLIVAGISFITLSRAQ